MPAVFGNGEDAGGKGPTCQSLWKRFLVKLFIPLIYVQWNTTWWHYKPSQWTSTSTCVISLWFSMGLGSGSEPNHCLEAWHLHPREPQDIEFEAEQAFFPQTVVKVTWQPCRPLKYVRHKDCQYLWTRWYLGLPRLKANGYYNVSWKAGSFWYRVHWYPCSIFNPTLPLALLWQVLDSRQFGGVPQRRKRLWIVGVKKGVGTWATYHQQFGWVNLGLM